MKGKYIYGIIKGDKGIRFSSRGLFNKRPYTVSYNDISAIVTDAPIKTYEADQEMLLSHNRVLDEAIKLYSVLPMRFGTVAYREDEVKNLLRSAYSIIVNKLRKIMDKVEFDIEISITGEQSIITEILEKNKEISQMRDRLISKGQDASMQDKLLIGKMIAEQVARYKIVLLKDIILILKPYYVSENSLDNKDAPVNFAFLVNKDKTKEFEAAIYKLGDKYGDKVKFKYTGPLAPYSFVELRMTFINFNTIDSARRRLGLGQEAATSDIKNAYRDLAKELHPDNNPGDKTKEEEFSNVASAYKLLCEYCRRYPKSRYEFSPKEIDQFSVLVED